MRFLCSVLLLILSFSLLADEYDYYSLLSNVSESDDVNTLKIDDLPFIAHLFLYSKSVDEKLLNHFEKLDGNYNPGVMFAPSLCLQLEHEKLKLLLARGYNFQPGLSEVGECYSSAIVKASLIMSQVLLEYSDNRGKQYFSELLSETIERVSNLAAVTEHRPIERVKVTRETYPPGEESFELNNKERNEILTLYYSKKFDAFFNRIFAFKYYDSNFLEVVNKRLCLDRTYDYFPKFLSSQLVKRNGMYERVFMSCVTYLLEERKYERLLYIVNKSELDESMRVKLKSRLDMSLIELVNMREVLKLKQ